jgi:hypothetical protein
VSGEERPLQLGGGGERGLRCAAIAFVRPRLPASQRHAGHIARNRRMHANVFLLIQLQRAQSARLLLALDSLPIVYQMPMARYTYLLSPLRCALDVAGVVRVWLQVVAIDRMAMLWLWLWRSSARFRTDCLPVLEVGDWGGTVRDNVQDGNMHVIMCAAKGRAHAGESHRARESVPESPRKIIRNPEREFTGGTFFPQHKTWVVAAKRACRWPAADLALFSALLTTTTPPPPIY